MRTRIPFDRLLVQRDALLDRVPAKLACIVTRFQVRAKSLRSDAACRRQLIRFHRRQRDANLGCDSLRNLTLQSEYVAEVALVGLSPELAVASGVDQLDRDSDSVSIDWIAEPSTTVSTFTSRAICVTFFEVCL